MKIRIEEEVFTGTATEIMDQLRERTFDPREFSSTDAYIRYLKWNLRRMAGIDCQLPEGSTEERAVVMLNLLDELGLLFLEEV